ncbi:MAG: SDR family oxidoreductase, partial [Armatimonadetes bacterium]|nr:SDR family oxidoreductase [Armatimonadota bacterium]
MSPLFDLSGKVALVTGAASGMGRAMSLALAQHGADLVVVDRNQAGLDATAAEIAALGRRVVPQVRDVSQIDQVRAIYGVLDQEFGRLDFAANVAGEGIRESPETISMEAVQETLQVLVVARFCSCQEAGRRMLAGGGGSLVNIGSLASISALGR